MEYNFKNVEQKAKQRWNERNVYRVTEDTHKPKFYILDMFPYPSGAGLHVGHPLGYIASDIFARYKRMKGFNVLHPMGFDAFGLPAEQYAIETGKHPAETTKVNIQRYREQLDKIGFCYDWSREVISSDEDYYHWTQWIFLKLFESYFDRKDQKAKPISTLIDVFEKEGNINNTCPGDSNIKFTSQSWNQFTELQQQDVLMHYRLAFCGYGEVNWCEALGTVLANDEVINGLSERGNHPVIKKKLRQWYLRITEYAERLIEGLESVDFSLPMKEMQRNWIGKSKGAEINFLIKDHTQILNAFTTRPDTIYGVDFMVLAPEHELITQIVSEEQKEAVEKYIQYVQSRSERERMAEKKISGQFTGAYAIHPFNQKLIPIWISEYVLAGYGTGAIMAVPCGDERDFKFAQHFNIPITNIIGDKFQSTEAYVNKDYKLINSDTFNNLTPDEAFDRIIFKLQEQNIAQPKINYKMRDAAFSRQRYWGEPFPIRWKNKIAYPLKEEELPLRLPHVQKYAPGPNGEGPLANIPDWVNEDFETNTMPGYAGSSWYFLRYMDPQNKLCFADKKNTNYWNQVDIYIGGTEHAVGHLLYSRMWTKILHDLGYLSFDEPFKKLINQGMIQGQSFFVSVAIYKPKDDDNLMYWVSSKDTNKQYPETYAWNNKLYIRKEILNEVRLRNAHNYFDGQARLTKSNFETLISQTEQIFNTENVYIDWSSENVNEKGEPILNGLVIEKMSKSKHNVVNPDEIVNQYGADTFRMYEMFLGPIDISKPWDTKGIEGVYRFLKKLWRLFYNEQGNLILTQEVANDIELKVLHKSIKKIEQDTERFSFNTAVAQFMILVNELTELKCHKQSILEPLIRLICPYAPHIAEELRACFSNISYNTIVEATYPTFEDKYTVENTKVYPVAINGKTRIELEFALDAPQTEIEQQVLLNETIIRWVEGKAIKKIIFIKGKMINIVV